MSTSFANLLLQSVAQFVRGEITLRDLRQQTIPDIYEVEQLDDPVLVNLADDLALYFAEHDHGDWTEEELREELRQRLSEMPPRVASHSVTIDPTNSPASQVRVLSVTQTALRTVLQLTEGAAVQVHVLLGGRVNQRPKIPVQPRSSTVPQTGPLRVRV